MDSTWDAAPLLPAARRADAPVRLALVLLWSREEPARVGEVALVSAGPGLLGRGSTPAPGATRLGLTRLRPGVPPEAAPFAAPRISRDQLRLTPDGAAALTVENVGRCRLLVNGEAVAHARVVAGDLVELEDEALFLVASRTLTPPVWTGRGAPPRFAFGEADEDGLVGESPALWALRAQLDTLGARPAHVFVRGESGTGKELVSQALHRRSPRAGRPLVARNAATIPATLVDAELFGNARNYPNPGMAERPGLVGEADGSTLFLDEFAELPLDAQAHLLRVLDQGEYHRLGEARARRADLRLVAATNRPESFVKADVLARLPLRVELPSLRDRAEDVPLLVRHLLRRIARQDPDVARRLFDREGQPRLTPRLVARLVRWPWTTNVRELERLLWAAIGVSREEVLDWPPGLDALRGEADDEPTADVPRAAPRPPAPLPVAVHEEPPPAEEEDAYDDEVTEVGGVDPLAYTPEHLQAVIDAHGGRQEAAWRALGFSSRHVLGRLVRRYGLRVKGRGGRP